MKLIFKHLLRSIRKKPLQPIIIILTLTLSISTAIFAFTLDDMMIDDAETAQSIKYGDANFMISVGNSSASRFLFVDDVIDVLGGSAKAVGCYELPLILDGTSDTTLAMATEFDQFSNIFDIEFVKYGKVTKGSVCDVAFVSEDFANQKGLSLGDVLTVETMGYKKDYQIQGISKQSFLTSYDVMVDISSVVRAFAERSLLFAAIGDDFKPCGKIYVNIDNCNGMTTTEAVDLLKNDSRFSEKNFEDLLNVEKIQSNLEALDVIVKFSVALAALLSAVIAFCCLYILAKERTEENLILTYSGASPKLLGVMQYSEVVFYWIIAVPLGILAAIPITKMIAVFVNLRYTEVSIDGHTVVKSVLIILAVCFITTTVFLTTSKRLKRTGTTQANIKLRWLGSLIAAIAALFVILYISPAALRLKVYAVTMAAIITLVFLATPSIMRWIASAIEKKMQNAQKVSVIVFRYALKNICSLNLLHNIARLCALIVGIIMMIGFVFTCANDWIHSWKYLFDAEYVVCNATDRCYEKTRSCESVEAVYRSYLGYSETGTVISADDLSLYSDSLSMECQPQDNGAVVSTGIAHKLDVKEGDTFTLELDGVEYELVVSGIERVEINYIAINCEDLDIPYNMLLVTGKDEFSSSELLADLSDTTSTELASVISIDALLEQRIRSIESYINAGKILLFVFLLFSLIGMINIFHESLRARREEFGFYCLAGMSLKKLRLMKILEIVITVFFGILIGIGTFIISSFAINRGLSGVGIELFLSMR